MKIIDTQPNVIANLSVDVKFQDLEQQINTSENRPEILKTAQRTFDSVQGIWKPAILYRFAQFQHIPNGTIGRVMENSESFVDMDFGYCINFLTHASHALVSVYTAGQELELESKKASQKGEFLEAFFIDLIGLIVLEKAGNHIKQIAEKKAADSGWGVSPFLSPGSVHGWDLEEQIKLCSLLPLEKINVKIRDDAVLSPFKTISSLIGLGAGYDALLVGKTCQVCSKRDNCQMKQV